MTFPQVLMHRVPFVFKSAAVALLCLFSAAAAAQQLPSKISDTTFWQLVSDLSEEAGYFPTDNFISNERSYQQVLPALKSHVAKSGAYLGVGPEQNFTYIATIRPSVAFIVDIRRQNMIEHLMYKALFELSADRREFLARLFSRPLPDSVGGSPTLEDLLASLSGVAADMPMFVATLGEIKDRLITVHGFKLTPADETSLEYVLNAFFLNGPGINYAVSPARNAPGLFPTYAELALLKAPDGTNGNFLASEENFQIIRKLQQDNRIIPLVGNFAGPSAIRGVGDYLRQNDTSVSVFYVSNVEQYLFGDSNSWKLFYGNVASLPLESRSVFIRALIKHADSNVYFVSPLIRPGYQLETMINSIGDLVVKFNAGEVSGYDDVVRTGNLSVADPSSIRVDTIMPILPGVITVPNAVPVEQELPANPTK